MIIRINWIPFKTGNHPELNGVEVNEPLQAVIFIEETSLEALTQKALKMRSREMFEEPYDPPEYL